ncbi:MAG: S49 family peptidase [Rhodocyclales bacterium]|nr:S49 family peptidase [Rhodocyclales bacterium]
MAETSNNEPGWERKVIEKLALEAVAEQKRRRRWGIFFKLLGFAYLTLLIFLLGDWGDTAERLGDGKKHTALVELNGVIKASGEASAEKVTASLQAAFEDNGTQGVILRINSPGGSPVQSGIINDEIRRLRARHPNVPLYAVVEDVCASGGYYVAAAADKIFVDKASVVGSIGVLMDGFGFTGTMDKLGVERRLLTAGENKGFLDPFSPQDGKHKEHAQVLLDDIHMQFIDVVRQGRGKRLKESPELFSGLMWTGAKSIELGLTDAFGSVDYVAREVIKAEDIRDYTQRAGLAERFARQFGTDMAESLLNAFGRMALR